MKFVLIYVTYENQADAEKQARALLENRLIACVNFFQMSSMYHWKNEIETANEIVAILKTRSENWAPVKEYILKNHSYETPCVIRLAEVEANDSYASWIQQETK